jgi:hypothetical protein
VNVTGSELGGGPFSTVAASLPASTAPGSPLLEPGPPDVEASFVAPAPAPGAAAGAPSPTLLALEHAAASGNKKTSAFPRG